MVAVCTGRGDASGGHCCWIKGKVCEFLIENPSGVQTPDQDRRFACGLMVELGDWDKVHADPRYNPLAIVFAPEGLCGDWQDKAGTCCNEPRDGD
jgi:hypothetical protein